MHTIKVYGETKGKDFAEIVKGQIEKITIDDVHNFCDSQSDEYMINLHVQKGISNGRYTEFFIESEDEQFYAEVY